MGFSHELCALNYEPACSIDNLYQGPVVLVSRDGGSSWNTAVDNNLNGRDIRSVSVDSSNPDIVYAATDMGVYKTTNAGDSWSVLPSIASNSSAYAVALNPSNANNLLVSIDRDGLYQSTDGGQTWKNASAGMEPNGSISTILFDPSHQNVVYVSDFLSWRLQIHRFRKYLDQDQFRSALQGYLSHRDLCQWEPPLRGIQ